MDYTKENIRTLNTACGLTVDVTDIKQTDIRAYDIAWSLHNTIRYNGHAPVAWDVLSHTGLAYMLYVQDLKGQTDQKFSLALLLHDAAETYVGDLVWALKHTDMGQEFNRFEKYVRQVIYSRFNLNVDEVPWDLIERYDRQAGAVEFHKFFPHLEGTVYAPHYQYQLERVPTLIKAKVADYIELLKHLAINNGVQEVHQLFDLPEPLAGLVANESRPLSQTTTGDVSGQTVNSEIEGLKL